LARPCNYPVQADPADIYHTSLVSGPPAAAEIENSSFFPHARSTPPGGQEPPVPEETVFVRFAEEGGLGLRDILELDLPEFNLKHAEVLINEQRTSLTDESDLYGLELTGFLDPVDSDQQHLSASTPVIWQLRFLVHCTAIFLIVRPATV
jgi:hypothetical protein